MQGQYDDLSQESWDSACDNMPQDYLKAIVAQMLSPKKPLPADYLDSVQKLTAIEARNRARQYPRQGQPNFDAPLYEWYLEHLTRTAIENAECEKYFA